MSIRTNDEDQTLKTQIRTVPDSFLEFKIAIERSEDPVHTIVGVPQFYALLCLKPAKRYSSVVMRHN